MQKRIYEMKDYSITLKDEVTESITSKKDSIDRLLFNYCSLVDQCIVEQIKEPKKMIRFKLIFQELQMYCFTYNCMLN
jgi:hypothetical protein